ncbi:MAG TPA: hypothetical protein VMU09_09050, partial [Acidimicrobiales bacterium]|nr:hypothetical protein [Acidimicrobiales bacterium]
RAKEGGRNRIASIESRAADTPAEPVRGPVASDAAGAGRRMPTTAVLPVSPAPGSAPAPALGEPLR